MFTLKLYGESRRRIVEALSFTVYEYNPRSFQITAHQKNGDEDQAFYVGRADPEMPAVSAECWYGTAIIENANGKTTEIINGDYPMATA